MGMDFGTQAVKTILLNVEEAEIHYADSFEYDTCFAQYGTRGGVLPAEHVDIGHTSPLMLTEALDLAFQMSD